MDRSKAIDNGWMHVNASCGSRGKYSIYLVLPRAEVASGSSELNFGDRRAHPKEFYANATSTR